MARRILVASAFSIAGALAYAALAALLASRWTSMSDTWLHGGAAAASLGLAFGFHYARLSGAPDLDRLFHALVAAAIPLCALGGYLAWLAVAHVWFSPEVPAGSRGLLAELLHPDAVPRFFQRAWGSGRTWVIAASAGPGPQYLPRGVDPAHLWYAAAGAILGPMIFAASTRGRRAFGAFGDL